MITLPNMGLKVWNLLTDPYDSTQLADNWSRVDQHDHSGGRGLQIPSGGIQDGAITTPKLASNITVPPSPGSVTLAAIGTDVFTDYSYGQTQYKDLDLRVGTLSSGTLQPTANTVYAWSPNASFASSGLSTTVSGYDALYLDPADRSGGSNRTVYYRLRLWISTNGGTAPTGTWTVGLANVTTTAGGSGANNSYTLGAAVAASATPVTGISASARTVVTGADFAAPAAGLYIPTFVATVTTAGNHVSDLKLILQTRTA